MPFLTVREVQLHYRVYGDNGPWLALITGGRRGFNEFIAFAEKIAAKGFRVLLHDRRNTGASDVLIAGADGEEEIWADDLAVLLGKLQATPAVIGGTSSGARLSMLFNQRHPESVKGLLLMRITGGDFAAGRLPEMYYQQFIRAAEQGGMQAVCDTEQYRERIQANPANQTRLMGMDPAEYIRVMQHWLSIFLKGPRKPVLGMEDDVMRAIRVPTIVVPGNDKTHASVNGHAAAALIPGSILFELPIKDQDVPLLPFSDWAPHEETLASVFADFMNKVQGSAQA
ncbi:alpha/beta hydrolase [Limnohabitans sp. Rim8]|uniref:alpha/beta fold hydrolase n=1 Tax=Limnohabitans sp. Rim8 TaxID=1100718 RepID=UPI00330664DB